MRMLCKNYEDAERLSRLFEESHIETAREGKKCWLVVDKVRRKKKVMV